MGDSSEWIEAVIRRLGSSVGHCLLNSPHSMLSALNHEYTDMFVCASVLVVTTLYVYVHAEYELAEYIFMWTWMVVNLSVTR